MLSPLGPFGPVGPEGPGTIESSPVVPLGPDGPVIPLGPEGPSGPVGPLEPFPRAPLGLYKRNQYATSLCNSIFPLVVVKLVGKVRPVKPYEFLLWTAILL